MLWLPLTGVVGRLPAVIFTGNGGGIPVICIMACAILMIFSVGDIAMSRHVSDAGAFNTYISKGLGENCGASASIVALIACFSVKTAVVSMPGFFTQLFLQQHPGTHVPWWMLSMLFVVIAWVPGIKRVEVGGKLPGVLIALSAMSVTFILVVNNLQRLSGSDSKRVRTIPWFIAISCAEGYMMSIKRRVHSAA
ncbi:amino acid transporter [Erwinia pyrifoliae]|uniref:Amino acid transporter n=1 Tax=Erwinia pyrifoliae TaxID=79967 RepID=A0ABY5X822_ERWPY|nr:amino acid transporter [Erwinia pyrifoliae]MCU8588846.1 amino acid transporter [Erwinia pyrifoliae]UWS29199.1 amino acid transporter [Erwinia pyrifoliae]UWS33501.1 amino acid transporter [Erwinia pyrifoliae]UXK12192.1 amino acid transporter [Erwinia pyrifoliae]